MRKLAVVLCTICAAALIASAAFATADEPMAGGQGGNTVIWNNFSSIALYEAITDLGGGQYRYTYSFTNTDTAGIWQVGVYTTFATSSQTAFNKSTWRSNILPVNLVVAPYDARNVNPQFAYTTRTWGPDFAPSGVSTDPIAVSESVSGFSFIAGVYDANPKFYIYELQGNYADATLHVSAAGYTVVPEPSALASLALGLGLVGSLARRRRG